MTQTPLAAAAAGVIAGTSTPQELLDALLSSTVFCEAPETPGVMVTETEEGPVVRVFSSMWELAASEGAVPWFSTSGLDLMQLLPPGHDLVLDLASEHATRLRTAALRAAVRVS